MAQHIRIIEGTLFGIISGFIFFRELYIKFYLYFHKHSKVRLSKIGQSNQVEGQGNNLNQNIIGPEAD